MNDESTKVHKPRHRYNTIIQATYKDRQKIAIQTAYNIVNLKWVLDYMVQHTQGEPADSKLRSGHLSPRTRRMKRSV